MDLIKHLKARAFNAGCDARLRGDPPIPTGNYGIEWNKYFRMGWWDVEMNWGKWSKNRVVKPLCKIKEQPPLVGQSVVWGTGFGSFVPKS